MSITSARRARETSFAMRSRATAAVDKRSSQKAIGVGSRPAKLRAKARVACARGPFVAVEFVRQAEDQREGLELADLRAQRLGVAREGGARAT